MCVLIENGTVEETNVIIYKRLQSTDNVILRNA